MSTFDKKEGIVGGPAWLRMVADSAKQHERFEEEQRQIADRRLTAARLATKSAQRDLIDAIPTGAGQAAAEYVRWAHLSLYDGRWEMRPGVRISEGAGELGDLARILGVRVVLAEVNGRPMAADPGDSAEVVMARYEAVREARA
jgi:hypothetical protein